MFDQLGLEVLDECYDKDPALIQAMVRRPLDERFQRQSCLELADVAQSRKFVSHKCCMLVIDEVWNGVVSSEVSIFRVPFRICFDNGFSIYRAYSVRVHGIYTYITNRKNRTTKRCTSI